MVDAEHGRVGDALAVVVRGPPAPGQCAVLPGLRGVLRFGDEDLGPGVAAVRGVEPLVPVGEGRLLVAVRVLGGLGEFGERVGEEDDAGGERGGGDGERGQDQGERRETAHQVLDHVPVDSAGRGAHGARIAVRSSERVRIFTAETMRWAPVRPYARTYEEERGTRDRKPGSTLSRCARPTARGWRDRTFAPPDGVLGPLGEGLGDRTAAAATGVPVVLFFQVKKRARRPYHRTGSTPPRSSRLSGPPTTPHPGRRSGPRRALTSRQVPYAVWVVLEDQSSRRARTASSTRLP
ncbi:hypothetical protein BN2537_4155 [Streptomyces venezuelae]|nr:hypothetical protein BN2537_4155 [Streptomyces venezuelae]